MVNPNHITPYARDPRERARARRRPRLQPPRGRARAIHRPLRVEGREEEDEGADPTEGMEPEEALHWHILRRKKDGVEEWIDRSVEKIGAVPTLNNVLLPAMKEVGDKFGAGELILPFVLQSAEVMKRAVAQLENYLDRIEGHTKGKVVIATVFGDVHDIGKSLVNTILTNNGYTVIDLGKQVPVDTIINAAVENEADAIGLSRAAGLDLQADAAVRAGAAPARARVPGAGRRRGDQPRLRPAHPLPGRQGVGRRLRARRLLLQGRLPGPRHDGPARSSPRRAAALVEQMRARRRGRCARSRSWSTTRPPVTDSSVRSTARTDVPIPEPPFWGAREIDVDLDDVYPVPRPPRAVQAPLGRARQEGRGVAPDRRGPRRRGGLRAAPRAHVARAGLPAPARAARLLPGERRRQRADRVRPRGPRARADAARVPAPAEATTASAWPTSSGRSTPASATSSPFRG